MQLFTYEDDRGIKHANWTRITIASILFSAFLFWVFPMWNVWAKGLSGEARLREAEQIKLIMIETAKAEVESARLRADAIEIVGESAKQFPEYRQQEFILAFGEALREGQITQIVYVPTEAQIPILEAGKR